MRMMAFDRTALLLLLSFFLSGQAIPTDDIDFDCELCESSGSLQDYLNDLRPSVKIAEGAALQGRTLIISGPMSDFGQFRKLLMADKSNIGVISYSEISARSNQAGDEFSAVVEIVHPIEFINCFSNLRQCGLNVGVSIASDAEFGYGDLPKVVPLLEIALDEINMPPHTTISCNERGVSSRTGERVRVAIIDTGISENTEAALQLDVVTGVDFAKCDRVDDCIERNPEPEQSGEYIHSHHAGSVAAILAAPCGHTVGSTGVSPSIELFDLKACECKISGKCSCEDGMIRAIEWIVRFNATQSQPSERIHIANISLGSQCGDPDGSHLYSAAVDYLAENGVVPVVGLGNAESPNMHLKTCVPAVAAARSGITVSGIGRYGRGANRQQKIMPNSICGVSNRAYRKPDLSAPAQRISIKVPVDTPGWWNPLEGTSIATPFVTGAVATLLAKEGIEPLDKIRVEAIRTRLIRSANLNGSLRQLGSRECKPTQDWSPIFGAGQLDVTAFLDAHETK